MTEEEFIEWATRQVQHIPTERMWAVIREPERPLSPDPDAANLDFWLQTNFHKLARPKVAEFEAIRVIVLRDMQTTIERMWQLKGVS